MKKHDEQILVVPAAALDAVGAVQGFTPAADFAPYQTLVRQEGRFGWRSAMEEDPTYKQIIPYLIFKHADTYFLMQRRADASEQRLKNKYSLGIGGHIRQEDLTDCDIASWAKREFHEEVAYAGQLTISPLGLINDNTSAVGRVHVGFAYLLEGDSAAIAIKSELKSGSLVPLDVINEHYDQLEAWSQLVVPHLRPLNKVVTPLAVKATYYTAG